MLDGLLKAAEILLGQHDKLREADADRRARVSLYFENVSRCLSDIATRLKDGTEPWQACQELTSYIYMEHGTYGSRKENSVAIVFGRELEYEVARQLLELSESPGSAVERLVAIRYRSTFNLPLEQFEQENLAESIVEFEKAAGMFKALSVLAKTIS